MRLLALVGSLRKASHNRALVRELAAVLPEGVTLECFERLGEIPTFDPDFAGEPEAVTALKEAIRAADGLVFATPEYNYSISGVLKNAIDWSTRPLATSPLRGKPCGILSASTGISGGMRAQYHLRQILVFTSTPAMLQPEVIIPRAQDRLVDGLLTDASTRELLRRFGAELTAWVRRFAA